MYKVVLVILEIQETASSDRLLTFVVSGGFGGHFTEETPDILQNHPQIISFIQINFIDDQKASQFCQDCEGGKRHCTP